MVIYTHVRIIFYKTKHIIFYRNHKSKQIFFLANVCFDFLFNDKYKICRTKPNELMYMQQSLQAFYDNDVNYIFSFSPESEHNDVLELMEEKAACTYFSTFTPDLFFYSSNGNSVWNRVFENEINHPIKEVSEKRKSSFWGRKRK